MRKVSIILLVFLLLLIFGNTALYAANQQVTLEMVKKQSAMAVANFNPPKINESLGRLAAIFASMVNEDPQIKEFIGLEVGKKFDADYDSLFEMVADLEFKGRTLRNTLYEYGKKKGESDASTILATIPYLNLAIPVHYDKWATFDGPIYVIPLRYDVDDLEITEFVGYGPNGERKVFSASTPPDYPVLVLGINERIEYLQSKSAGGEQISTNSVQIQSTTTGTYTHTEVLSSFYIRESTDGWLFGSPEIYILVCYGDNGSKIKIYYGDVDTIAQWVSVNRTMFSYINLPQNMFYYIELRESDFGTYDEYVVTKTFWYDGQDRTIANTFSTDFQINASDESLGWKLITFFHEVPFECVLDGEQRALIRVTY